MERRSGWAVWLTGLPSSGKTTLAQALRRKLRERGVSVTLLDSDAVRRVMTPRATYAPAERDWFYNRLVELAVWLVNEGEHVIIAATGNKRSYRAAARARLGERFNEVWVRCAVAVCRARDTKGLYGRAAAGEIRDLPGADAAYEEPEQPEAVVDTDRLTPEAAADALIRQLPLLEREAGGSAARATRPPGAAL